MSSPAGQQSREVVVAVDIGGTFTDVVVQDLGTNAVSHRKVSTTTGSPAAGIVRGIRDELSALGEYVRVNWFLHGTTIATNALIEGKGVRCGLLITAGFRGIPQIQSGAVSDKGDPRGHRPAPLVREEDIVEIPERVDSTGRVLVELDEAAVRRAAKQFASAGVQAVGICFLFSFLHAEHERRARDVFLAEYPGCTVLCSADILPRVREWPRCSTVLLSCYLEPIMRDYISCLREELAGIGIAGSKQFIMESNGGVLSFDSVIRGGRSIHTLLSGPAGAVQAGRRAAEVTGLSNLVTMDIGGTSCDIAFIEGGAALEITTGQVSGYDLHVPMLDITTIGAGGGTIARVTEQGRLTVGPDSAGAIPGPAAYGRGGQLATTTDADLALGYLNPDGLLGGEVAISKSLARKVIQENIADPLGLSLEEAALGIREINDTHMAEAIRVVAARKGLDIAECTLVACGGAGPVHAGFIAEELGLSQILVPPAPGVFSALGLLCTDIYHDYVQSILVDLDELTPEAMASGFAELEQKALAELEDEGFAHGQIAFASEVDARYGRQGHEIRIPLQRDGSGAIDATRELFHTTHEHLFGHAARGERVQIVSYRLRAIVAMPKYQPVRWDGSAGSPRPIGQRQARFGDDFVLADIWLRADLCAGQKLPGPAVVEQDDTTVLVLPGWEGSVDEFGNLRLCRG